MEYKVKVGKSGVYGEYKIVEWSGVADGKRLATYEETTAGDAWVVLYTSDGKAWPRRGPNDSTRIWAICEAHVRKLGYTEKRGEYYDVRAYND